MTSKEILETFLKTMNQNIDVDVETAESVYNSLTEEEQRIFMDDDDRSNERMMVMLRATNRMFCGINGTTYMDDEGYLCLTWDSAISELPVTFEVFMSLLSARVRTIGDLARIEEFDLDEPFRKAALMAYDELYHDPTVRLVRLEEE